MHKLSTQADTAEPRKSVFPQHSMEACDIIKLAFHSQFMNRTVCLGPTSTATTLLFISESASIEHGLVIFGCTTLRSLEPVSLLRNHPVGFRSGTCSLHPVDLRTSTQLGGKFRIGERLVNRRTHIIRRSVVRSIRITHEVRNPVIWPWEVVVHLILPSIHGTREWMHLDWKSK